VRETERTLFGVRLLQSLDPDELRALAKRCHWHRYKAGQQIISYRDTATEVYFVIGGKVRASICSRSGREVTFRDLEAGQMFGELSAIDRRPRSASVVTLTESLIVSMSAEVFREVRETHPEIAELLLQQTVDLVRDLSDRVYEFTALGVRNRIHAEVLRLALDHMRERNAAEIVPAPTHADIASRISTHREAVTRELNELHRAGLIDRAGHAIIVKDVARLRRLVQDVGG